MEYLEFQRGGGKFSLAPSTCTKRGKPFSPFFLYGQNFFGAKMGPCPNAPLIRHCYLSTIQHYQHFSDSIQLNYSIPQVRSRLWNVTIYIDWHCTLIIFSRTEVLVSVAMIMAVTGHRTIAAFHAVTKQEELAEERTWMIFTRVMNKICLRYYTDILSKDILFSKLKQLLNLTCECEENSFSVCCITVFLVTSLGIYYSLPIACFFLPFILMY